MPPPAFVRARKAPATKPASPSVSVEGLAETLSRVRHELDLISHASKFDWVNKRLILLRNLIFACVAVAITVVLVVVTYREVSKDVLVINGFDVPTKLEERGFTGRVIGRKLFDQITYIRTQTLLRLAKRDIVASVWKAESDVTIPDTKLTVGAVFSYLRGLSGRDTFIDGELTEAGEQISVTVRQRGKPSRTVTGKFDELDALMLKAAEHILFETQPAILAQFRLDRNDRTGAMEAARVSARSGNPEEVGIALTLWGRLLQLEGDPGGARTKWDESLRADPRGSRAWSHIASQLVAQDRIDEAITFLEQRTRQFPGDVDAWSWLAGYYLRAARPDAQLAAQERVLSLDPNGPLSLGIQGGRLANRGDYAGAVEYAERMERAAFAELDRRSGPAAVAAQIGGHTDLRNFERAMLLARRNIAERPTDSFSYALLGLVQTAMHDYDNAIASHRKSLELGVTSNTFLVQAMTAKGDLDAAQKLAESNGKRSVVGSLSALGTIYYRQGRYELAATTWRKLISISPGYTSNYANLGRTLAQMGDTNGAEEQFNAAIAHGPKFSMTYQYWGEMLAAKGDHVGAIIKYQKALELDPRWGEPYAKWGESLLAQGDAEAAKAKFAKALELEPMHPDFQKYKP